MDDRLTQMYNDDDLISDDKPIVSNSAYSFRINGKITELTIDGKKISIIDPSVLISAENTIRTMQSKIALLEQEVRRLNSRLSQVGRMLENTMVEVDKKVGYE